MILEGTVISKETGLRASFGGVEQPYVRCVIARLDNPDVQSEARVIGVEDLPVDVGGVIRLEVVRVVTDRRDGIVRFDCRLIE